MIESWELLCGELAEYVPIVVGPGAFSQSAPITSPQDPHPLFFTLSRKDYFIIERPDSVREGGYMNVDGVSAFLESYAKYASVALPSWVRVDLQHAITSENLALLPFADEEKRLIISRYTSSFVGGLSKFKETREKYFENLKHLAGIGGKLLLYEHACGSDELQQLLESEGGQARELQLKEAFRLEYAISDKFYKNVRGSGVALSSLWARRDCSRILLYPDSVVNHNVLLVEFSR